MIEFDIATLAELRAEDNLQDYYDNIAEKLILEEEYQMAQELKKIEEESILDTEGEMIELIEGPVYYGCLESLSHEELVYKYQQLSIEYERFADVRN
tara:strand:+ start:296 stop:586 length:291 start_codon:yes stop_codon:yes gene_type:complete